MSDTQSPQEYFRLILLTVVGQAYTAAGYELEELPLQWAGGRFRFRRHLDDDLLAFIEYQLLSYSYSEWASGQPSRFRVTLTRTDQPSPGELSQHPRYARRDLSALVVEDFGVPILPSGGHWWTFHNTDELGQALAEAGHLVVGYGLPWLTGDLLPPASET
jgi:hypothetical protein